ncbi:MAG: hypothetical protein U0411_13945 [Thermodesulfovibrionales bacterium]
MEAIPGEGTVSISTRSTGQWMREEEESEIYNYLKYPRKVRF